jgi:hypothetical protein
MRPSFLDSYHCLLRTRCKKLLVHSFFPLVFRHSHIKKLGSELAALMLPAQPSAVGQTQLLVTGPMHDRHRANANRGVLFQTRFQTQPSWIA